MPWFPPADPDIPALTSKSIHLIQRTAPVTITATEFFTTSNLIVDPKIEARFYGTLKMRNGTFKLTRASRFDEIERVMGNALAERAARFRSILDVGVSTGVTTAEFADFLSSTGAAADFVATDLYIDAYIVEPLPGIRVLAGHDGWPMQYDIRGKVIRPWIRRLDYLTLAFIPRTLARMYFQRRAAALIGRGRHKAVRLISPRLAKRTDIKMIEDDILIRSPSFLRSFDLVRAANILNRDYFSESSLFRAIGNIHSYLRGPGAMFLITRTDASSNNAGTLFELDDQLKFEVVKQVGGGSEIEEWIVGRNWNDKSQ